MAKTQNNALGLLLRNYNIAQVLGLFRYYKKVHVLQGFGIGIIIGAATTRSRHPGKW